MRLGCRDPGPGRGLEGWRTDVDFLGWRWTFADFLGQAPGWHWTVDSDQGLGHPALAFPSPVMVAATIMLTPRAAFLLTLLPAIGSLDYRAQRPPRPLSHFSTIQPKAGFDAQQFAGTWLLVAVASSCRFLQEQGHQAEATALQVAPQGAAMRVSTFRKLDGICWQVQQLYRHTRVPGHFLLQAQGAHGKVDVVVGETDYRNFAILYLQRAQQLSVKLYVRSLPASDAALSAFEQRVQRADLTEDHILFFPNYGFCEAADQFHILDEVKR